LKFHQSIIIFILILSGCADKPKLYGPPEDLSLSGVWAFDRQDERSVQYMINRLNHVPLILNNPYGKVRRSNQRASSRYLEQNVLRDLLVGLFTIVPKELYILQSDDNIAIDFGVAGYHKFNFPGKSEIILDGLKIQALSGWKQENLHIQLNIGNGYQLIETFTLINKEQLLETIELKFLNGDNSLIHKRYYVLD